MTTQTLSYIDAIAHLPPGGTLILTDVPWEDYEQLLAGAVWVGGARVC